MNGRSGSGHGGKGHGGSGHGGSDRGGNGPDANGSGANGSGANGLGWGEWEADFRRARRAPLLRVDERPVGPRLGRGSVEHLLPHRDPLLLIDEVTGADLEAGLIVGSRWLDPDDPVFAGHFPGTPIYPASLQLEMAGQLALCLHHMQAGAAGAAMVAAATTGATADTAAAPADDTAVAAAGDTAAGVAGDTAAGVAGDAEDGVAADAEAGVAADAAIAAARPVAATSPPPIVVSGVLRASFLRPVTPGATATLVARMLWSDDWLGAALVQTLCDEQVCSAAVLEVAFP